MNKENVPFTQHIRHKPTRNKHYLSKHHSPEGSRKNNPNVQSAYIQSEDATNRTPRSDPSTLRATNTINNFSSQTSSYYNPFESGYANSTFGRTLGGLLGSANPPIFPPAMFDSGLVPPLFSSELDARPDYNDEKIRQDSFKHWARSSSIRPNELAKAGFYYLGYEDRVQCAFCKGVLRNWDALDDALEEHKKHFPTCPFIKNPQTAGNIPAKADVQGVHLRKELANDTQVHI